MANATLIPLIDALLPQTQCGQCGHPGCAPYAQAIADGEAINHCVPGGQSTIDALARLLDKPSLPLDPAYGVTPEHRLVAFIREDECIGCTKCIQACPVDAIVGAAKQMHTIMVDECTGCDLCVAPCPVDCIDMVEGPDIPMTWHKASDEPLNADEQAAKDRADKARERFETLKARQAKLAEAKAARRPTAVVAQTSGSGAPDTSALMIAAALARSQLKKTEKQLAALNARGEDASHLQARLPELSEAVSTAEAALAKAKAPGSKRVRTTGAL
ncbi:MAG: electron transport complex subunit RsxB [Paraperlucidibaca sp.]|jgi:electron transport complex protein RnfB|uniref:electron transport complex subunit RsxB n=1 Tax=Paraperlucidibaca sp. TaxID=2708021 RepID=UPI001B686AFF|nr:electron transport complex subunit RsxB [Paraperlucidibaca sp.]MBQ0841347.1 electron transport complex subunit RsxB [Paraperlucidibaca sp.]